MFSFNCLQYLNSGTSPKLSSKNIVSYFRRKTISTFSDVNPQVIINFSNVLKKPSEFLSPTMLQCGSANLLK